MPSAGAAERPAVVATPRIATRSWRRSGPGAVPTDSSSGEKIASIGSANSRAMRKANGRLGS